MITLLFVSVTFITGLLLGFYGRQMHDMLKDIYDDYVYRREATQAGVVRPEKRLATRAQPQDMSVGKESGVIMKPSPMMARISEIDAQRERNKKLGGS